MTGPRKVVAFALGLFAPGSGQVLAGQLRLAIVISVLYFLAASLGTWLFIHSPLALWLHWALELGLIVVACLATIVLPRDRTGADGARRILLCFAYVLLFLLGLWLIDTFKPQGRFAIHDDGMAPTLINGDRISAYLVAYKNEDPKRGDVTVITDPTDRSTYVRRVVGIPGDTIEFKGKTVFLNGAPVSKVETSATFQLSQTLNGKGYQLFQEDLPGSKTHFIFHDLKEPSLDTPQRTIPAGQYLLLSDNRDHAADSRVFGLVHKENIRARVEFLVLSIDPNSGRPLFDRWGKLVQ